MLRLIRNELKDLDTGRRALRSFGCLVGGVFVLLSVLVIWHTEWIPTPLSYGLASVGALLVFSGALTPTILRPVYLIWMGIALVLGIVMTRVLLTIVFFLVVMPTALVLRILGKDLLQRKIDRDAPSYWIPKKYDDPSPSRFEKYY